MRTATAGLQAALATGTNFVPVELYEISLVDGSVWYLTSFDYPVIFTGAGPRNGRVYQPQPIQRSDFDQQKGTTATKFQLIVANKPGDTTFEGVGLAQNVLSGRWLGATIYWLRGITYTMNTGGTRAQVSEAPIMHFGRAGDIKQDRSLVTVDINSVMELMNMDMPWRVLGPECRWTLFDSNCQAVAASFAVNGTVLTGSTNPQILATLSQPTGYFDQGVLIWTSGANNGTRSTVRSYIGTGLSSSYPNIVITDKPIAYYRFASTSLGIDSSGHGRTGTVHGAPFFTSTGGPLAGGSGFATFHGNPDYIDISTVPSPRTLPNFQAAVSFEFFFNVTGKQPNGAFGSGAGSHDAGVWNFSTTAQSNPGFKWGQNHPFADFTAITGQWVHCAAVFRGQRFIDIYLNGLLSVTVDDFGSDSWEWLAPTIGKAVLPSSYTPPGGLTQWFVGEMAEFAIYDYPMDAGQVFEHYLAATESAPSLTTSQINLVLPLVNLPQPGDTFTVYPGCPKSLRACIDIFNNKIHFGGAPFIPPSNQAG